MTRSSVKAVRNSGSRLLSEHLEPLPVTLTPEEFASRATSLVRLRDDERKAEAEFEQHKHRHKTSISAIAEERERLEQAIREKREPRPVKVESWAHYDVGQFREVRADTGEVLNERPLLAAELQGDLPLGDA